MLERINLVPRKVRVSKAWPKAYTIMIVFFAFVFYSIYLKYNAVVGKFEAVENATETAIKKQDSIEDLQGRVKILQLAIERKNSLLVDLGKSAEKVEKISGEKYQYTSVLKSIEKELPDSVKCNVMSIDGAQGFISGISLYYGDLPGFVEKLKKHDVFSMVQLQSIGRDTVKGAFAPFSFKITFDLNQQ